MEGVDVECKHPSPGWAVLGMPADGFRYYRRESSGLAGTKPITVEHGRFRLRSRMGLSMGSSRARSMVD